MKTVDLSIVHFSQQGFRSSYAFAIPPEGSYFDIGEHTSDFLGYFGFGSGRNQGSGYPKLLDSYVNFEFSCIDDDPGAIYPEFIAVLQDLSRLGITPDINGVKEFVKEIFRVSGVFSDTLDGAIETALSYITKDAGTVYPVLVTFSIRNGARFLSFGVRNYDGATYRIRNRFAAYPHLIWTNGDMPFANWKYYTQLGGYDHTKSILSTMRRHKFVDDWEEMNTVLTKSIESVNRFYSKI